MWFFETLHFLVSSQREKMRRVVEYKTKSLSVNPFRSWGFPWLGKKARPEGPREEGGAYYVPNTAQSLSRRAFAAVGTQRCCTEERVLHQQQLLALCRESAGGLLALTTAIDCLCKCSLERKRCTLSYAAVTAVTVLCCCNSCNSCMLL